MGRPIKYSSCTSTWPQEPSPVSHQCKGRFPPQRCGHVKGHVSCVCVNERSKVEVWEIDRVRAGAWCLATLSHPASSTNPFACIPYSVCELSSPRLIGRQGESERERGEAARAVYSHSPFSILCCPSHGLDLESLLLTAPYSYRSALESAWKLVAKSLKERVSL